MRLKWVLFKTILERKVEGKTVGYFATSLFKKKKKSNHLKPFKFKLESTVFSAAFVPLCQLSCEEGLFLQSNGSCNNMSLEHLLSLINCHC